MKKQLNSILNKCKSFSRHLGKSSSYSYTAKSDSFSRDYEISCWVIDDDDDHQKDEQLSKIVLVGQTRKPYTICSKYLNHPLLNAVIEKESSLKCNGSVWVKCEVVLFDHLLWMLDDVESQVPTDTLQELVEFYAM